MTSKTAAPRRLHIGVGGWTYEPWRGLFYPDGLPHARELAFASRALTSLEINGTYYSTFKPPTWRKWHNETPGDFVFSVKASRYCTNRKSLGDAGPSIERFLSQGLTELGPKLGPINWQLMASKRFEAAETEAFLALLPAERDGVALRHALEVRHPSFACAEFAELARRHGVAIVRAIGSEFPEIDDRTAAFTYCRIMSTQESLEQGIGPGEVQSLAALLRSKAEAGEVFGYVIGGAKLRNPAAARALIEAIA